MKFKVGDCVTLKEKGIWCEIIIAPISAWQIQGIIASNGIGIVIVEKWPAEDPPIRGIISMQELNKYGTLIETEQEKIYYSL